MIYWVEIAGFILVAVMLVQQVHIQRRSDNDWERTAAIYRWSIRAAILFGAFATVILIVMTLTMDYNSWFFRGYERFYGADVESAALLLVAFFSGVIRLFFERASDDPRTFGQFVRETFQSFFRPDSLRERIGDISYANESNEARHDSWFWWFLIANASALTLLISDPMPGNDTMLPPLLMVWVVNLLAILGYFGWVYVGIFNKMTRADHFSGRAARLFLGNFWGDRLPQQVIVMGPVNSGKSVFIKAGVRDTRGPQGRTTKVVASTIPFRKFEVTAIDSPGRTLAIIS